MSIRTQSWLEKVQRYLLMLILSVAIIVQFTQMAAASQDLTEECISHCDHAMWVADAPGMGMHESGGDHHGAHDKNCAMMACLGLIAVQAVPHSSMHDLSAAEYANAFRTELEGPILPQLGKPPKHI
jgi:hypothetical protein